MTTMKTPTVEQLADLDIAFGMLREAHRMLTRSRRVEIARRIKPALVTLQRSRARAWSAYRRANPGE